MFLTIFLHSMYVIHLKYDMMIFFPGNFSGFRIFSGFFRIVFKFSNLQISVDLLIVYSSSTVLIKYDMMVFFPGNLSDFQIFSRIFPDFPGFFSNLQTLMVLTIFLEIFDSFLPNFRKLSSSRIFCFFLNP